MCYSTIAATAAPRCRHCGRRIRYELWADDLYAPLTQLQARQPTSAAPQAAGCHCYSPCVIRALLLWRVTGGPFAAQRLAHNYGQFIEARNRAACRRCAGRSFSGSGLPAILPIVTGSWAWMRRFIDVMAHWREYFLRDADLPVIGASAAALGSITVPTCVIPGNDRTHPRRVGENASRLLPNSELHILMPQDSRE